MADSDRADAYLVIPSDGPRQNGTTVQSGEREPDLHIVLYKFRD